MLDESMCRDFIPLLELIQATDKALARYMLKIGGATEGNDTVPVSAKEEETKHVWTDFREHLFTLLTTHASQTSFTSQEEVKDDNNIKNTVSVGFMPPPAAGDEKKPYKVSDENITGTTVSKTQAKSTDSALDKTKKVHTTNGLNKDEEKDAMDMYAAAELASTLEQYTPLSADELASEKLVLDLLQWEVTTVGIVTPEHIRNRQNNNPNNEHVKSEL
jgi:hypothetical protein